ncbi:hypothetical protein RHGRI_019247 [Rhododendron griersonianum]|uniref:Uncharacterized protein n=1 Tax=Rhododendron griersonianum TaxID=479676 RepID=A0AAV6JBT1_9ERIC|nr:hypothetical protein RHGRI_019247 [Rhododendron griersonianum]
MERKPTTAPPPRHLCLLYRYHRRLSPAIFAAADLLRSSRSTRLTFPASPQTPRRPRSLPPP